MAHKGLILALGAMIAAPLSAAQPDSGPLEPNLQPLTAEPAPAGTPQTKYCMRVDLTGYVIEQVRCWTRDQWAEQGVDVDRDWHDDGVRVVEG